MGVIAELGYAMRPPNALQRANQKMASSRAGSWLFQRTLYAVDRPLFKLTKGRVTAPGVLAGLPVVMLTTVGAKSGRDRTMPLVGIPLGDDLAVIGTNYGQQHTPGWVYNLRADPEARVAYRARSVAVTARRATAAEAERAFEVGGGFYGGFPKYRRRAAHREIEVFVLEPR
ncbi:MAG TPA: nitroreductase family deazaflavin-dependent oxidoreductase [Ilumatobacter sp.]